MASQAPQAEHRRPPPLARFPDEQLPKDLLSQVKRDFSQGFFGSFDLDDLALKATAAVVSNSDADEAGVLEAVQDFMSLAQQDCQDATHGASTHSCWLDVRMTLPSDQWATPRWHTDGRMFHCSCPKPQQPHSKYAVTLLGPGTRIKEPNQEANDILRFEKSSSGQRWDTSEPNGELADRLKAFPEIAIETGEIIRFSWGQADSPIHSEPDFTDSHRVFVSLLFGNEEEVWDMCKIRGKEYGAWYSSR